MRIIRPKKKNRFITTYIIAGGFLLLILLGTVLLHLPAASANGEAVPLLDALFSATTSVCVTGLVTLPTFSTWSLFGQIVILILIQLGGLGIITFTVLFLQLLKKRVGMRQRQLIKDAYNLDSDRGLNALVRKIFLGTMIVEGIGALLYCIVLVPEFGAAGIWKSVFNAVSAFCNAGMDIIGPSSLLPYQSSVIMVMTTIMLIVLGGLGFPIWFMFVDKAKEVRKGKISCRKAVHSFSLYGKLVIFATVFFIVTGAVAIFLMEYSNPATMADMSLGDKVMNSVFQSVTTRTAGFFTIPQEGLRRCTVIVCSVLMFIGGSPSGTAGGIKTTTIIIFLAALVSALRDRNNTELFRRRVSSETVRKAMSVFMVSFTVLIISLTIFCMVQPGAFEDCLYEVVSAVGTVGLSRDLTGTLTFAGKIVIIVTMYLGRIGPISLGLFFNTKKYVNLVQYPEENVPIG